MQTLLSSEDELLKKNVEDFTRSFLSNNTPINLKLFWQELFKNNFIDINITLKKMVLLTESISKIEPGIGLFLLTNFSCLNILNNFATTTLKEKYLNKLISGELIGCFSLTEKNAGSDISLIETTIKKQDSNFILNGEKIWASNALIADLFFIFAQEKEFKNKSGITCILLDKNEINDGLQIKDDIKKLGVKITPSSEIIFNSIQINSNCLIGNIGDGIKIALNTILCGRIFCAAQAVGLLSGIVYESVKHALKRNQFGKAIADFQIIQWYIAEMQKDLDAARLLLYKAMWAKENSQSEALKLASMAKYFSTSVANKHASKGVQILGGSGLMEDSFVAKAYRDSKVLEIYEGTNEIQKLIISNELSLSAK